MAYTENEIYYPNDYNAEADVLKDMKKLAESVDGVVGKIKGTQATQNTKLNDLETDNTSNKANITNLQNTQFTQSATIQSLQSQNTRLKANQIPGYKTGTEVEITDSAEIEASIGVGGESIQEEEPTSDIPSPIKNLTGNVECTVTNENIIDINEIKGENSATTFVSGNSIIITRTHNSNYGDEFIASYSKQLKPNTTYTFDLDVISDYSFTSAGIYVYSDKLLGEAINKSKYESQGNNKKWNITTDDTGYVVIGFYSANATEGSTYELRNVLLIEGSETKTYIEHKETTVIFPLGEQKLMVDGYLAEDGIHNVRGQKVLDGTENWGILNNAYYISISDKKSRTELTKGKMLCSHFKETNATGYTGMEVGEFWENYYTTGNKNVFFNYDIGVGGVENWKAYLAEQYANGTPVIVEYELAESTTTPHTTEQKEAYDKLQNLILFKGYNYIEMVAENGVKANLEVDYIKSTEMYTKSLEERIQALENAVLEV